MPDPDSAKTFPAGGKGYFQALLVPALVFALMLTWLVREFSRALLPLFPLGNNQKADLLHQVATVSQPVFLGLAAALLVTLASLATGHRRRIMIGGATLILSVSIVTQALWLSLLLLLLPYIGVKSVRAAVQNWRTVFAGAPFVVIAAALVLVTFTINMNYYLPGQGIWYLLSLCTLISIFSYCLVSGLRLVSRVAASKLAWAGRFVWLLGWCLGLGVLLHGNILSFSEKLNLVTVPWDIPAALAVLIFLIFGDQFEERVSKSQTPHFKKILTSRLIGLAVILNFGFRYVYTGERDLILDVFQDVLFVLTCGMMTLAMMNVWTLFESKARLVKLVSWTSVAGIFLAVAAYPLFNHKTWSYAIEGNREFSRFVSGSVRGVLSSVGISDKRDVARKEARLHVAAAELQGLAPRYWTAGSALLQGGRPPHIFVFVSDATTSTRMGVYGYERDNTPHLNEFARDSLLYTHFYSASSATFQGVVAMFSGAYGGRRALMGDDIRTRLCTGLHEKGYRLIMAGIGYDIFETGKHCAPAEKMSAEGYLPDDYDTIKKSLQTNPGQPHFVYQHVNGGHNPWQVAAEDEVYGKGKPDIYDAMLRVADRQFGELVAFLKKEGIYDNSIIIFTADHGIGLGFHMDKSSYSNLYAQNSDIPFLMKIPGVAARKVTGHYSHVDLLPGFAEVLGFSIAGPIAGYGLGLTPTSTSISGRCVFSIAEYKNTVAMNCQDGKKLIWNVEEKLLHIFGADDPLETRDLIDDYSEQEVVELARPLLEFVAGGRGTYIQ